MLLVACSAKKAPGVARAVPGDLYTGSLFLLSVAYAERTNEPWMVLSAKYGLVPPTQEIDTYNQRMGATQSKMFKSTQSWPAGAHVIAGRDYLAAMPSTYPCLVAPDRIGYMLSAVGALLQAAPAPVPGSPIDRIAQHLLHEFATQDELYCRLAGEMTVPGLRGTIRGQLLPSSGLAEAYGARWHVRGTGDTKTYKLKR